jgi:hypothetical protein
MAEKIFPLANTIFAMATYDAHHIVNNEGI